MAQRCIVSPHTRMARGGRSLLCEAPNQGRNHLEASGRQSDGKGLDLRPLGWAYAGLPIMGVWGLAHG